MVWLCLFGWVALLFYCWGLFGLLYNSVAHCHSLYVVRIYLINYIVWGGFVCFVFWLLGLVVVDCVFALLWISVLLEFLLARLFWIWGVWVLFLGLVVYVWVGLLFVMVWICLLVRVAVKDGGLVYGYLLLVGMVFVSCDLICCYALSFRLCWVGLYLGFCFCWVVDLFVLVWDWMIMVFASMFCCFVVTVSGWWFVLWLWCFEFTFGVLYCVIIVYLIVVGWMCFVLC